MGIARVQLEERDGDPHDDAGRDGRVTHAQDAGPRCRGQGSEHALGKGLVQFGQGAGREAMEPIGNAQGMTMQPPELQVDVEDAVDALARLGAGELAKLGEPLLEGRANDGVDQRLLGAEVAVERIAGEVGLLGDLVEANAFHAFLGEAPGSNGENGVSLGSAAPSDAGR